jgi:hypothetical protein
MTPEEAQMLKAHADEIAAILYRNTDPTTLKSLEDIEDIEQTVRTHLLQHVSPHIGTFLSEKRRKQQPENPAPSKAVSDASTSPKNKPKR